MIIKTFILLILSWPHRTFVETHLPLAMELECEYQVSHVWLLAHAGTEAGWRTPKGNNFFGVKARKGEPFYTAKTIEFLNKPRGKVLLIIPAEIDTVYKCQVWEKFRAYKDPRESFVDYIRLLRKRTDKCAPREILPELCGSNYMTSPDCREALGKSILIVESTLYRIQCGE